MRSDSRAPADARLAVYASAYQTRIRDALGRDLPALAAILGGDGFHDLVLLYLLAYPPSHPSLRFAGSHLADFLAEHAAAEPFRRRWPFAADLARLEWALVDAFDAPDAAPLLREDLQQLPLLAFDQLVFSFHPSALRLSLGWPVHRLLEAVTEPVTEAGGAVAPAPHPEPTEILVWRRGEEPCLRALAEDEARVLDAARSGAPFGALCELLAAPLGPEAAATRAAAFLASWTGDGLLRRPA